MKVSKKYRKVLYHDGEQLGFYKKVHIKTHKLRREKDGFVIFVLQEANNFN